MEKQSKMTTRQEWQQEQQTYQEVLDLCMEEMADAVNMWNLNLRVAAEDEDSETVNRLAGDALDTLNDKWQFFRDMMIVSGSWYQPKQQLVTDEGIMFQHEKTDVLHAARSMGFRVVRAGVNSEWPQICMAFSTGQSVNLAEAGVDAKIDFLSYARINEISLTYMRPDTAELLTTDMGEFVERLSYYDSLLELHTHSPMSEFYNVNAKTQRQFFESVLKEMDDVMPSPSDWDVASVNFMRVPRLYAISPVRHTDLEIYAHPDGAMHELSGRILGFTVLDLHRNENEFPLRSAADLIDKDAGLCLIVEVGEENINMQLTGSSAQFLVPVRSASAMSVVVR